MIYLDYSANTPVDEAVLERFCAVERSCPGNANSRHQAGAAAKTAIDEATQSIARSLNVQPAEIVYTSGASEANNFALKSIARLERHHGKHIISTPLEHSSVSGTLTALQEQGYEIDLVDIKQDGTVDLAHLRELLRPDTILVSMMLVNNELGSIYPIADIAKGLKAVNEKTLLHTDAVQGFLKVPFSAKALGADFIAISGHKVGAPKGIGALYIGPRVRNPRPLLPGGGQEMGLRSGTEATAQIAGFAKAVELRWDHLEDKLHHMAEVKAYAVEKLTAIPDLQIIGSGKAPHVLSVSMAGWPSQNVVNDLGSQGICVSAGSACHHGKSSQVVSALGLPKRVAAGVIRLSFGPETTFAEIDACAEALRNHHDHRMPML